jgi:hypothetical protein
MIAFEDPLRRFVPLPFKQTWRFGFGEINVRASDEQLLEQCGSLRAAVENGPVTVRSLRAVRETASREGVHRKIVVALPLALLSWGETQMYLDLKRAELLCFAGERCLSGDAWPTVYLELAMAAAMVELQTRDNDSTPA